MTAKSAKPQQRYVYTGYHGKDNPSERDRIVHLLDTYGTTEGFVAQYLPKWINVSSNETVKGGLRTVQAREAAHARLMKSRLRELGESSKAEIPAQRREMEMPFFASPEHTDAEKLKVLVDLFGDGEEFLRPVTEIIDKITDDLQTRELLRTILDDERESVGWIQAMYQTLSTEKLSVPENPTG
jgi:ferritin-like protein